MTCSGAQCSEAGCRATRELAYASRTWSPWCAAEEDINPQERG